MNLQYKELLNIQNCQVQFKGNPEVLERQISGFSIDSRTVQPGDTFIAIQGENFDGHQFISDVHKKDVQVCIVSQSWFRVQTKENQTGDYFIVEDFVNAVPRPVE